MKSIMTALLLAVALVSPSMASDLEAELLAREKSGWLAWAKRDTTAMKDTMTEDAVQVVAGAGVSKGRDKIIADVSSHNCQMKEFEFSDSNLRQLSPDVAILTYTATQDTTCDGQKLPAKVYSTAVYVRQDGKWRSTSYQETALE
jgi:uncharacterized protein (TIGR02246 family)